MCMVHPAYTYMYGASSIYICTVHPNIICTVHPVYTSAREGVCGPAPRPRGDIGETLGSRVPSPRQAHALGRLQTVAKLLPDGCNTRRRRLGRVWAEKLEGLGLVLYYCTTKWLTSPIDDDDVSSMETPIRLFHFCPAPWLEIGVWPSGSGWHLIDTPK